MASSSTSLLTSDDENFRKEVLREMRNHEIAIGELNSLSASRVPMKYLHGHFRIYLGPDAVYQQIGKIYFRRSIENAKTFEGKKLEAAKAQFQKLNAA